MIYLILAAAVYGILEQWAARKGNVAGKKIILGHFAFYHFLLLVAISMASLQHGDWGDIPLMILIEDIFFYIFSPKILNRDSWSCWGLGGIDVGKLFIPWTYVILFATTVLLKLGDLL